MTTINVDIVHVTEEVIHRCGNFYVNTQSEGSDPSLYMLTRCREGAILVSVHERSNRWNEPVDVYNDRAISINEFSKISRGGEFKYVKNVKITIEE